MSKPSKALLAIWYRKLAESGFVDAEDINHPDMPLKKHHSILFKGLKERMDATTKYYNQALDFYYHDSFESVCKKLTNADRMKSTPLTARRVWKLHCNGLTERQIAKDLRISQPRVHKLIERFRAWMKIM